MIVPFGVLILLFYLSLVLDSELEDSASDVQFYAQHLIRELGRETYIGQRAIVSVSQRISAVGESLLFMDPFDDNFPSLHEYLFIM